MAIERAWPAHDVDRYIYIHGGQLDEQTTSLADQYGEQTNVMNSEACMQVSRISEMQQLIWH